jgi:hypothetical protein
MPKFLDRSLLSETYSPNKRKIQRSENWTHVEDDSNELINELSQTLTRLSFTTKCIRILNNPPEDKNIHFVYLMNLKFVKSQQILVYVHRLLIILSSYFVKYMLSTNGQIFQCWSMINTTKYNKELRLNNIYCWLTKSTCAFFLLTFMKTQSFVSFVDMKIATRFNEDNHCFDISYHINIYK